MMLVMALNLKQEAEAITEAVSRSVEAGFVTVDLDPTDPKSTSEVGDRISDYIRGDV
jgi:isocitrate/isopropylmalate dehydrogenase